MNQLRSNVKPAFVVALVAMSSATFAEGDTNAWVVSQGGTRVWGDPCRVDAFDDFARLTGYDPADKALQRDGLYAFRKSVGPFSSARLTCFKKGERKPLSGGTVKSVRSSASLPDRTHDEALAELLAAKSILERELHVSFVAITNTPSLSQFTSAHPLVGGWNCTLRLSAPAASSPTLDLTLQRGK